MSAVWAPNDRNGDAGRSTTERRLRAVPRPPARMARVPFLTVLIALFGVGMAGLLMLNTTLQNQAFAARSLDRQATELAYRQAELESQISRVGAPQELVRRASALGLRPNPQPAFLEVPSGDVLGTPTRVAGDEEPLLVIKTPAERAAAKAQRAAKARTEAAEQRAKAAERAAAARAKALAAQRAQQAAAARAAAQAKAKAAAEAKARAAKTDQQKAGR